MEVAAGPRAGHTQALELVTTRKKYLGPWFGPASCLTSIDVNTIAAL